jgi:hypothetical protein
MIDLISITCSALATTSGVLHGTTVKTIKVDNVHGRSSYTKKSIKNCGMN